VAAPLPGAESSLLPARSPTTDFGGSAGCGKAGGPVTVGAVKAAAFVFCLAALGYAPLQCASEPDETLRRNETPDEAVYGLAEKFREHGNEAAWRETLEYLIERYPNSRHAARARQDLGQGGPEAGQEP